MGQQKGLRGTRLILKTTKTYSLALLQDASIRRSLDGYIKNRIRDIPGEINQTLPGASQVWKCENAIDFLYGYYVGKIEEGALHYLLKATRASAGGYVDAFEIRGLVEEHRRELRDVIAESISTDSAHTPENRS